MGHLYMPSKIIHTICSKRILITKNDVSICNPAVEGMVLVSLLVKEWFGGETPLLH